AGAAAFVAFGVCALGDSPLRQPGVAIVVALAAAGLPTRQMRLRPSRAQERVAVLAFGAMLSWLLSVSVRSWVATAMRTAADAFAPAERARAIARSLAVDPTSGEALLDLGLMELAAGEFDRADVHLELSRGLLANAGTSAALGEAALGRGDPAGAERAYA